MQADTTHHHPQRVTFREFNLSDTSHLTDLARVASQLRTFDKVEADALGVNAIDALCHSACSPRSIARVAFCDGEPVFVFGVGVQLPHVAQLWGAGTDKSWRIMPALTRHLQKEFFPELFIATDIRRIQVDVLCPSDSFEWLKDRVGFRFECLKSGLSLTAHEFAQLAITRDAYVY